MNENYKTFINDLFNGLSIFYPESIFGEEKGKRMPFYSIWPDSSGKSWKREEFREYVLVITKTNDTEEAAKVIKQWKQVIDKGEELLPNMPSPDIIERAKEIDQSQEEPEKKKKDQQVLFAETQKAKAEAESKVVYLEPIEAVQKIQLSPQEELAIGNLEKAARENPREFVESFAKNIVKNLPAEIKTELSQEELEVASKNVAADFLGKILRKDNLKSLTSGAFVSLINSPEVSKDFKKETLPTLVTLSETSEAVVRSFLYTVVGEKVTEHFYKDPKTEYRVTPTQTPNSVFRVDLGRLQKDFQTFKSNPIYGFLEGKVKSEITKHGKKVFSEFVSRLPRKGFFGFVSKLSSNASLSAGLKLLAGSASTYQATNIVGWTIQTVLPDFVPVVTFAAQRFGINVGLTAVNALSPAAVTVLETGAVTGVVAGGAGAGVTGAGAIAGTALGTTAGEAAGLAAGATVGTGVGAGTGAVAGAAVPIPGLNLILAAVGAAIGAIVTKVVDKIKIWIKKNPEKVGAIALVPVVAGLLLGSVPLLLVGGVAFVSVFFVAKSVGVIGTGIASFTFGVMTSILGASIGYYGKAITLTILSLVAFTALALFIINSGAYIVPPSTSISRDDISQSPYIRVTKEASVTSISNSQLPIEVTYTITIEAPLGALTNVGFKNECNVIRDGSTPSCAHPLPEREDLPPVIDTTTPYVFTYSQTYDSGFTNSLVTDTFTVDADVPGNTQQTSIASASVVIGTPPTACFDVRGTNWPANYKGNILAGIATLRNSYPVYTAKLCQGGTVRVVYDTTKNPGGWGYYSGGTMYFNGGGLSSTINALYILSHESGHHYSFGTPAGSSEYVQYRNNAKGAAAERPLCSYSNTTIPSEAFAEAIALYVTNDQASSWTARCSGTFQSTYPAHYNFANDIIFR